jgi:hypothetical protein
MDYPVVTRNGHNFEREAIMELLERNSCVCPISGNSLFPHDLIPNYKLQKEIEEWHRVNKDGAPTEHPTIEASAVFFEGLVRACGQVETDTVTSDGNSCDGDDHSSIASEEKNPVENEKKDEHHSLASKIRGAFFRKQTRQDPRMQQTVAKSA